MNNSNAHYANKYLVLKRKMGQNFPHLNINKKKDNIILKSSLAKREYLSVILEENSFKERNSEYFSLPQEKDLNFSNFKEHEQTTSEDYFNSVSEGKNEIKDELLCHSNLNNFDSSSVSFYENINFNGGSNTRKHFRTCKFCLLLKVNITFKLKHKMYNFSA
jgi:hypothetical protein